LALIVSPIKLQTRHSAAHPVPRAADLVSKIQESEAEVRELLSSVPGFRSYGFVDTGRGAFSVTTCEDKEGTDESSRRAAEWIRTNMPGVKIAPPQIIEGEGVLRFVAEGAPA
jgi:hypothetical protein